MNILIIAPHPDDEVLGCGGTIAKYSQRGDQVTVCYGTRAYTPDWSNEYLIKKEDEICASNSILGISNRIDLGYPTVKLDIIPQKEIADSLINVVKKIKPNYTFIPHRGDINKDHQIIHDAALVALRPSVHRCTRILVYETLSETEWGTFHSAFEPKYYVDITDTIEKKLEAMRVFTTEIKESPHPRSCENIMSLAKKRGSEILVRVAEAFMVYRIIDELELESK